MKAIPICFLCKSTKFRTLYASPDRMFNIPGLFVYIKCISCGLVFLDPQPDKETLRKHYPTEHYFAYDKEGKGGVIGSIREYLVKRIYKPTFLSKILLFIFHTTFATPSYRQRGKVLDVGCATGDMLVLLKDLGWDTYGIDIDEKGSELQKNEG